MNKLVLNDDSEFDVVSIYGGVKIYQNKEREYLDIVLTAESYSIDDINEVFQNEKNIESLKIKEYNEDNNLTAEYIHNNFCILMEISKTSILIEKETDSNAAVYIPVIRISLGQLTYSEIQQREQTELVNATAEVLGDLIGGAN